MKSPQLPQDPASSADLTPPLPVLAVLVAGVLAAPPAQASVGTWTTCKGTGEGYEKVDGRPTYTSCVPARATVTIAGRTYAVKNGLCNYDKTNNMWQLRIGKNQTGQAAPTTKALSIRAMRPASPKVPSPDGQPFPGRTMGSMAVPGEFIGLPHVAMVFDNSGRTGTFTGTTLDGRPVNGSFSCR